MAYDGVIQDIRKCVNLTRPGRIPAFACSEEFNIRFNSGEMIPRDTPGQNIRTMMQTARR